MNKKIKMKVNVHGNDFYFQNHFVWRDGFELYLTIDEISGNNYTLQTGTLSFQEYEKYGEQYKLAVEKYKKLKVFM